MEPSIPLQQSQRLLQHEAPLRRQADSKPESVKSVRSARSLQAGEQRRFWLNGSGDIFLALGATYFIVLALISISKNDKTLGEVSWLPSLVTAASYGSTLFPILFSAAFGRFLTQLAYSQLERGTTVQTIEQLQGSQTVISTLVTQFTLRAWNRHFLLISSALILIWSFSPFGSQASLRFISLVGKDRAIEYNVSYLDVAAGYVIPHESGYSQSFADMFFGASLMLPATLKSEPQDLYGNIRVPLIEQLEESPSLAWVDVTGESTEHSSLLGVPFVVDDVETDRFSFCFNTSYWWQDCQTELTRDPPILKDTFYYVTQKEMAIAWASNTSFRAHDVPRTIYFKSPKSYTGPLSSNITTFVGVCNMTTTFIAVNATCQQPSAGQRSCAATAVRRASLDPVKSSQTQFDVSPMQANTFLHYLVNSTTMLNDVGFQMVPGSLGFLADPQNPFNFHTNYPDWSNVTARDFSVRFSQLFNTYFLATSAYQPLRGVYIEGLPDNGGLDGGFGSMLYTNATGSIAETALACNAQWTAMLLLAALVVLAAAVSSLVLGSRRRCPEVLNNFSVLLKDNVYAVVESSDTINSMADGSELAKAWRAERVQIGDVMTDHDAKGYVAIGTPNTVSIGPLGSKTTYI